MENEKEPSKALEEDIWSSILNNVASSGARIRSDGSKSLLVLGDVCSGKSTLVDRLCNMTGSKGSRIQSGGGKYLLSGCSLEYRFLDVQDDETDDFLARMGVWVLDGVVWHKELLPFVLNEKNIDNTLVMIVVDLTQPWTVIESLERWSEVIYRHVNSLKIPDRQRRAMEEKMVKMFQNYVDPEQSSAVSAGETEEVALPLDPNVLTCNLGIPLIVVCAKSDGLNQLEKSQNYKDEHFDFIQQHIRRFCLKYGAALCYTSFKDSKNLDLLHRYIVHLAYRLPFNTPASIVERDAVFIPCGWDSDKRIYYLSDQMKHINPHEPLQSIIVPPRVAMPLSEVEGVSAEDDQVFLIAQQAHLARAPKREVPGTSTVPPAVSKDRSPVRPIAPLSKGEVGDGETAGGKDGAKGEAALATFFSNLLMKPGTGAKGAGMRPATELKKPPKST